MRRRPENLYKWILAFVTVSGIVVVTFDVAKKTIFLGASWNYDYPAFSFVYDIPATVTLVALSVLAVAGMPYLFELDKRRFAAVLFIGAWAAYGLSFFALPEKAAFHALTPDKGMYCASLEAANNGVLSYFQNFHEIGHCPDKTGFEPKQERIEYIQNGSVTLQIWIANAQWFPWHEEWAAYAGGIGEQKHGPIPPLLAAGSIVIFGQSPGSAAALNYTMAALLAPLTYYTLQYLFDEELSRAVAIILMFVPVIFIYVRKHVVAYDTHTAVFVFATMVLFVKAVSDRSHLYTAFAGVTYSLAFLSKITAIPLAFVFLFTTLTSDAPVVDSLKRLVTFVASALVLPLTLLAVGYNFVLQYLFQFALQSNLDRAGGLIAQNPNPDLGNPILNLLGALYHFRLFSIALLAFLLVFLAWAILNRGLIRAKHRYHYAVAFLVPMAPFVIFFLGLNLGRQLLPYFIGIALLAASGLNVIVGNVSHSRRILLYRVSVAVTAAIALINL